MRDNLCAEPFLVSHFLSLAASFVTDDLPEDL